MIDSYDGMFLLAWFERQRYADAYGPTVDGEQVWRVRCSDGRNSYRAAAPTILEAIAALRDQIEFNCPVEDER
jgi:hypothetical protein